MFAAWRFLCLGACVQVFFASASTSARRPAPAPKSFPADGETRRFVEMPGAPRLPEAYEASWMRGCEQHKAFVAAFDASGGALTEAAWDHACRAADALEALAVYKLDPARQLMLYAKLVEVYGTLSRDTDRAAKAAQWCVQQAVSPGCADAYAIDEASPKDAFNTAVSSAITYYRRAGDAARAEATRALANKHPLAATRYDRVDQTPKVYFPGLTARRFWDPDAFDVVRRLKRAYADPATRARMLAEVDGLAARGALARLVSPSAPFRPPSAAADAAGAGAWSELPLYDGRRFDEAHCALCPTLASLLRGPGGAAAAELGAAPADPAAPNPCGTDVVACVLRLAPGSRILPHCGVTNRRLILQFALRGSDGVTFTVGGDARGYGGDGGAIVFDDSFEHAVAHDGDEDRYVLFAILKHPDLA